MYESILKFWFEDILPSQWWVKNEDFDKLILDKFLNLHKKAVKCELFEWRQSPRGRLGEIIILDQLSRNIYRNTPKAFENDHLALSLSQEAIFNHVEKKLNKEEMLFVYMPFMHSESLAIQKISIKYFQNLSLKKNLEYAYKHYEVIKKFGRFPHRNDILNRRSTFEERKFLMKPGSTF